MVDFSKLYKSVIDSRLSMQPLRELREEAVKQYVGKHYSDQAAPDRVPVNMVELAATVYTRNLVAQRPRVLVSTSSLQYKPCSALLELAVNHTLEKMKFGKILRKVVMEGMFGVGAVKVGLDEDDKIFVERIDLDDLYIDIQANDDTKVQWIGNRYTMLMDDAVEAYGEEVRKFSTTRTHGAMYNEGGDEKAYNIMASNRTQDPAVEEVALIDIYIPSEGKKGKIYTFPAPATSVEIDGDWTEPLREEDWDGPDHGPYHILPFNIVPGNVLPVPPVAHWLDLHELGNKLFRKLGRQAERQKTLTLVAKGGEEDAEAIKKAGDGDIVPVENPQNVGQVQFGGVDQGNLAFLLQVRDLFSWFGGNLDALGGLSAQSSTATQDSLLHESASKRLAAMQTDLLDFTSAVVRDVAWWIWDDKSTTLDLIRTIGDLNIEIPAKWTKDSRKGDFLDYTFDIEPFSMQYLTPAAKSQAIMGLWQQVLLPGAPFGAQQGVQPDMHGMLRTLGKLMNLNEIEEIVQFTEPAGAPGQPQAGSTADVAQANSGKTERRYVRENVPTGGTPQGRTAVAMQSLMGKGVQPKQAAQMGQAGSPPARV